MIEKDSPKGANILSLVLVFVAGFAVFSLIGFVILIILLSAGILPSY